MSNATLNTEINETDVNDFCSILFCDSLRKEGVSEKARHRIAEALSAHIHRIDELEKALEKASTRLTQSNIDKVVKKIGLETHWNDHSGAVVTLAKAFGSPHLCAEAQRIKSAHSEQGHMTRELEARRELVKTQILLSIEKVYGEMTMRRVLRAF